MNDFKAISIEYKDIKPCHIKQKDILNVTMTKEKYAYGILLETSESKYHIISNKMETRELYEKLSSEDKTDVGKALKESYIYKDENQVSFDVGKTAPFSDDYLDELDIVVDNDNNYYIVHSFNSKHVVLFDTSGNYKVYPYGGDEFHIIDQEGMANRVRGRFRSIIKSPLFKRFLLNESTESSSILTKISTLRDCEVGQAYVFNEGAFVVTDMFGGKVYLLGPDNETYIMTLEEFNEEVIDKYKED